MSKVKSSELTYDEMRYGVIPVPNFEPNSSLGCSKCYVNKISSGPIALCEECLRRNGYGGYYVKSEVR